MRVVLFSAALLIGVASANASTFKPAPWQERATTELPKLFGKIKEAQWSQDISLWLAVQRDNTQWDVAGRPICSAMDGFGRPEGAFVIITFLDAADIARKKQTTLAKFTCPDAKALPGGAK